MLVMSVDSPKETLEQVVKYLRYRSAQHEQAANNQISKRDQMKSIAAAAALLACANELSECDVISKS